MKSTATIEKPEAAAAPEPTVSEKFVARIEKQFAGELGSAVAWSQVQRTLAQHLYIKLIAALDDAENRRYPKTGENAKKPIIWANVDDVKLAMRCVHIINLGLDAYQKNHIFFIPYWNNRTERYDIDIRIGYMGEDHCRRKFSLDPIVDITYQLVFEGDEFDIVRNGQGVEVPEYHPKSYFEAPTDGIIGGFGYIQYEDVRKNKVIPIAKREFEKAQTASKGTEFWGGMQTEWQNKKKVETGHDDKFFNEMCFKTIVHRVCAKIPLDPAKVNMSAFDEMLGANLDAIDAEFQEEVATSANTEPLSLTTGEESKITTEVPAATVEAAPVAEQASGVPF